MFLRSGEGARNGSSDAPMLRLVPTCTRSHPMSEIIIKLSKDGFHNPKRGRVGVVTVVIYHHEVILVLIGINHREAILIAPEAVAIGRGLLFPDRTIDVGEDGIEAVRDPMGLNIASGSQKCKGVDVNVDMRRSEISCGRVGVRLGHV